MKYILSLELEVLVAIKGMTTQNHILCSLKAKKSYNSFVFLNFYEFFKYQMPLLLPRSNFDSCYFSLQKSSSI